VSVDGLSPGEAMVDLAGVPAQAVAAVGWHMAPDELPDGLVVADHAGRVTVFNRAAARLTGISAADVLGADVRQALPLRDADGRCWWMSADPYDGLPTRTRHPEMSLYLHDGTELLVTVGYVRGTRYGGQAASPGGPGPLRHLVISLRGAQQRARLERTRADLVSTVAHELRSPLTSVKGFTATLLAKWTRFTDDQKRVMLETVNADADRVTRLITELLDVSRIESGRMEIHRQLVSIPEQVQKIVAGRVAAGEPADRFRTVVTGELPETWLDADKVDQILGNLVENAIRHGAGTVTVVVEPVTTAASRGTGRADAAPGALGGLRGPRAAGGPAVAVSVRDEGDGIAPELVPRVFRQFWRTKRRGGAGLGLFIVKGLVEAHGGTITVQRAPGGGAEFRFIMPAGLPDFG
jgi:signal transduction histidine kinase